MLFFLFLGMYGIKVRWEYEVVLPNVEKLWIAYCNRVANIEWVLDFTFGEFFKMLVLFAICWVFSYWGTITFFAISRLKRIGNENISSAILESGDIEMLCDSDVGSVRVIFALPDRFYL